MIDDSTMMTESETLEHAGEICNALVDSDDSAYRQGRELIAEWYRYNGRHRVAAASVLRSLRLFIIHHRHVLGAVT